MSNSINVADWGIHPCNSADQNTRQLIALNHHLRSLNDPIVEFNAGTYLHNNAGVFDYLNRITIVGQGIGKTFIQNTFAAPDNTTSGFMYPFYWSMPFYDFEFFQEANAYIDANERSERIIYGDFIHTAQIGSRAIQLKDPTLWAGYSAGHKVLIYGWEGYSNPGFPSGAYFFEFNEVVHSEPDQLILKWPLRHRYDEAWEENDQPPFEGLAPKVIRLNSRPYHWREKVHLKGISFLKNPNLAAITLNSLCSCGTENFILEDCEIENFWPSVTTKTELINSTIQNLEIDKLVGTLHLSGCDIGGMGAATSCNRLIAMDNAISLKNSNPLYLQALHSKFKRNVFFNIDGSLPVYSPGSSHSINTVIVEDNDIVTTSGLPFQSCMVALPYKSMSEVSEVDQCQFKVVDVASTFLNKRIIPGKPIYNQHNQLVGAALNVVACPLNLSDSIVTYAPDGVPLVNGDSIYQFQVEGASIKRNTASRNSACQCIVSQATRYLETSNNTLRLNTATRYNYLFPARNLKALQIDVQQAYSGPLGQARLVLYFYRKNSPGNSTDQGSYELLDSAIINCEATGLRLLTQETASGQTGDTPLPIPLDTDMIMIFDNDNMAGNYTGLPVVFTEISY